MTNELRRVGSGTRDKGRVRQKRVTNLKIPKVEKEEKNPDHALRSFQQDMRENWDPVVIVVSIPRISLVCSVAGVPNKAEIGATGLCVVAHTTVSHQKSGQALGQSTASSAGSHLGSHLVYPAGFPAGVGTQSFNHRYQTVITFIFPVQLGEIMDPTPEQETEGSTECKAQGLSAPRCHPDWGDILRHLAKLHKQMVAYTLRFISSLGLLDSFAFLLAILTIGDLKTIQSNNTFIHLHLNFCHFLSHLLFLAGIHWTLSKAMCIMIGMLCYSFLASFAWIFLGRLFFYLASWSLKVVDYFSTIHLFRKVLNFSGYGIPALHIGLFIAIQAHDINNYNNCWINSIKDSEWIFVSPICVLIMKRRWGISKGERSRQAGVPALGSGRRRSGTATTLCHHSVKGQDLFPTPVE
ncbi:uncharacterized protein LOC127559355 isoform X2 [Antechinus flavipes]|uniref:uncharacterized protein LOC127559355 isoform X2 n=1 Tax=Antechinus flavipes TaxID=38775 RepID=UPI0022365770|nr:uncharacterized protein LOC127559355 isoform X2 [Antechinus flavipes]